MTIRKVPTLDGSDLILDKFMPARLASGAVAPLVASRVPDANLPARLGASELSATFASKVKALTLDQLGVLGTADQAKSLAGSQVDYADAGSMEEAWADTSQWTAQAGTVFVCNGNRLFGPPSSSTQSLVRAVPVSSTGRARYRTKLTTVVGGAERYFFFGWSRATAGTASAPGDIMGVGFHILGSSTSIITWDRGAEAVQAPLTLGATYYVTAGQDETQSWVEMTDAAGSSVYKISLAKSTFAPAQLAIYLSDARGVTGDYVSGITGRGGNATHPFWWNQNYDNVIPSGMTGYDSTPTPINVLTPANYDSRKPSPLVIYCHGWGGTELSMTTAFSTQANTVLASLLANGYVVATSYQTGPSEAGTGYLSIANLYKYVRDHYAVGPVIIMSESFGGVSGLLTIAKRTVPNIVGWLGWYPVTNLAALYAANPTLKTGIDAAYNIPAGGTYAVQTAGFDPATYAGSDFRGMRMRTYGSTGDTAVNVASNAQSFIAQVAPYAIEAVHVTTSGDHGDPSNFVPSEVLAFVNRCIGK